jgi:hypothetical protein
MKTLLFLALTLTARAAAPIDVASRWELFVDEFLVAQKKRCRAQASRSGQA